MVKKILLSLLAALLGLIAVLAVNTLRKGSRQLDVPPLAVLPVDEAGAATRLSEAVRLRTVSSRDDASLKETLHNSLSRVLVVSGLRHDAPHETSKP